jgi:hypothetical protein
MILPQSLCVSWKVKGLFIGIKEALEAIEILEKS